MTYMDRRTFLAAAATTVGAAALPRSLSAARSGGGVVALVTADLESHIVAVETATGRVVKRIATAPGPRSIESNAFGQVVVAHSAHGKLSVIDAATLTVVGEIAGLGEPRNTTMHPFERLAYVSEARRGAVAVIDLVRRKVVARVDVRGHARHLSLSDDGKQLWVALGTKAERVAVVDVSDPHRPRLLETVTPPFLIHDVAWAPGGGHIWVTSGTRNAVAIYVRGETEPTAILGADAPPQHIAFSSSRVYVASGEDGTVRVHRLDGRAVGAPSSIPEGSYNISFAGAAATFGRPIAVTPSLDRGTVCLLRPTGEVQIVRKVARSAHDACVVEAG